MKPIQKSKEPASLLAHRKQIHSNYDNYPNKDELRDYLLAEQGYICCYCMQRIKKETMKIEHWQPQSKYQEKQLDYQNLLAACQGNAGKPKQLQHGDTHKGEQEITINPINNLLEPIKYRKDGRIYSDDHNINQDLNNVLNLNTQTLVNNRAEIIDEVIQDLTKIKGKQAAWSVNDVKRELQKYEAKNAAGEYEPYCQAVIYFLNKRFAKQLSSG
ncbi:MAG: TIGR02646 family protein [Thioploca sp.]|nr:TIGR02646 family protein [Thioploca sp.]